MKCIHVHNVNQGLAEGLRHLQHFGELSESRVGQVLVGFEPVSTTYEDPTSRVLFSPLRNANPFFHLMEALWMLAGRHDLAWPRMFNKKFKDFSDDGVTLHGAYGYRWRRMFGVASITSDQLSDIIQMMKLNPDDRRAVLTMWSPQDDLGYDSRDIPCNTHAYFDMRGGKLNMTVCCRSNDIWWGCYGANAVHFSILLEYMAGCIGCEVGRYTQISNNFHLYPAIVNPDVDRRGKLDFSKYVQDAEEADLYTYGEAHTGRRRGVEPRQLARVPLVVRHMGQRAFDVALNEFLADAAAEQHYPFFRLVASPMYRAWATYKLGAVGEAMDHARTIAAADWRIACTQWLERKLEKAL